MPAKYLYDIDALATLAQSTEKKNAELRLKRDEAAAYKQEESNIAKEKQERATLAKLKAKFEA